MLQSTKTYQQDSYVAEYDVNEDENSEKHNDENMKNSGHNSSDNSHNHIQEVNDPEDGSKNNDTMIIGSISVLQNTWIRTPHYSWKHMIGKRWSQRINGTKNNCTNLNGFLSRSNWH
jgi:hypothetical protein